MMVFKSKNQLNFYDYANLIAPVYVGGKLWLEFARAQILNEIRCDLIREAYKPSVHFRERLLQAQYTSRQLAKAYMSRSNDGLIRISSSLLGLRPQVGGYVPTPRSTSQQNVRTNVITAARDASWKLVNKNLSKDFLVVFKQLIQMVQNVRRSSLEVRHGQRRARQIAMPLISIFRPTSSYHHIAKFSPLNMATGCDPELADRSGLYESEWQSVFRNVGMYLRQLKAQLNDPKKNLPYWKRYMQRQITKKIRDALGREARRCLSLLRAELEDSLAVVNNRPGEFCCLPSNSNTTVNDWVMSLNSSNTNPLKYGAMAQYNSPVKHWIQSQDSSPLRYHRRSRNNSNPCISLLGYRRQSKNNSSPCISPLRYRRHSMNNRSPCISPLRYRPHSMNNSSPCISPLRYRRHSMNNRSPCISPLRYRHHSKNNRSPCISPLRYRHHPKNNRSPCISPLRYRRHSMNNSSPCISPLRYRHHSNNKRSPCISPLRYHHQSKNNNSPLKLWHQSQNNNSPLKYWHPSWFTSRDVLLQSAEQDAVDGCSQSPTDYRFPGHQRQSAQQCPRGRSEAARTRVSFQGKTRGAPGQHDENANENSGDAGVHQKNQPDRAGYNRNSVNAKQSCASYSGTASRHKDCLFYNSNFKEVPLSSSDKNKLSTWPAQHQNESDDEDVFSKERILATLRALEKKQEQCKVIMQNMEVMKHVANKMSLASGRKMKSVTSAIKRRSRTKDSHAKKEGRSNSNNSTTEGRNRPAASSSSSSLQTAVKRVYVRRRKKKPPQPSPVELTQTLAGSTAHLQRNGSGSGSKHVPLHHSLTRSQSWSRRSKNVSGQDIREFHGAMAQRSNERSGDLHPSWVRINPDEALLKKFGAERIKRDFAVYYVDRYKQKEKSEGKQPLCGQSSPLDPVKNARHSDSNMSLSEYSLANSSDRYSVGSVTDDEYSELSDSNILNTVTASNQLPSWMQPPCHGQPVSGQPLVDYTKDIPSLVIQKNARVLVQRICENINALVTSFVDTKLQEAPVKTVRRIRRKHANNSDHKPKAGSKSPRRSKGAKKQATSKEITPKTSQVQSKTSTASTERSCGDVSRAKCTKKQNNSPQRKNSVKSRVVESKPVKKSFVPKKGTNDSSTARKQPKQQFSKKKSVPGITSSRKTSTTGTRQSSTPSTPAKTSKLTDNRAPKNESLCSAASPVGSESLPRNNPSTSVTSSSIKLGHVRAKSACDVFPCRSAVRPASNATKRKSAPNTSARRNSSTVIEPVNMLKPCKSQNSMPKKASEKPGFIGKSKSCQLKDLNKNRRSYPGASSVLVLDEDSRQLSASGSDTSSSATILSGGFTVSLKGDHAQATKSACKNTSNSTKLSSNKSTGGSPKGSSPEMFDGSPFLPVQCTSVKLIDSSKRNNQMRKLTPAEREVKQNMKRFSNKRSTASTRTTNEGVPMIAARDSTKKRLGPRAKSSTCVQSANHRTTQIPDSASVEPWGNPAGDLGIPDPESRDAAELLSDSDADAMVSTSCHLLLQAISKSVGEVLRKASEVSNSNHLPSDMLTAAHHLTQNKAVMASLLSLVTESLTVRLPAKERKQHQ